MKQASRYFDLIIMILIGVVGLISTISSIASINDLNTVSTYLPSGSTLYFIIWLVNLLLSIGFIAECLYAIRFFRKGNMEKVSKAIVDTFTFYGGMCFISSVLSLCFLDTVTNSQYTISGSAIFQMIWCLVIAIAGVIFSVKKVDGKKIPYYISIPSLSGGVLVALVCNVSENQSGLNLVIFILFIIISIAGIVLPILKKFYPYEGRDNNHVTTYESVNSKPINTSNDYATKLRELKKLHDEGILDDDEYRLAKENIINKL